MLSKKYGEDYPLPKKELPKWLVWLIGPLVDKNMTRKTIAKNMGHDWQADNSKSKDRLGLKYRSLELSITEMFQQMIDQGAFKKQ
jgi:dihydroflavonol-4-reductase